MNHRRRRRAAALTLLLVLPLAGATRSVAPSLAQEGPAAEVDPGAVVTLATIDPVVAPGDAAGWSVVVEHAGPEPWQRLEVIAELHGALGSRSALRVALAGGAVPPVVQRTVLAAPLTAPLVPGGTVRISGSMPMAGAAIAVPGSAIHPLRLRVLADGDEVGRITTALVRIGDEPSQHLATTLVWPLEAPPARDASGDVATLLDPLTVDGGRLDTLVSALGPVSGADAPFASALALSVPAHLVEDLARRGADVPTATVEDLLDGPPPERDVTSEPGALRAALLLQRIRITARALPDDPVVTPYADADVSRLLASGTEVRPLASRSLLEGPIRTATLLGRETTPVLLLDAPVAAATLDLVPTGTVIVPYTALEAPDLALDVPLDEPVRLLRSPTGRTVTALVGDPYLTLALGASTRAQPDDPVRAAHEVLVRTAMVHLEAPGREGRTLVLLPPPGFDPDPRFAAELLGRLAAAPWLEPAGPEHLAASPAPEPAVLRPSVADPLPSRLVSALTVTERDLRLLSGALDPETDRPEDVMVGGWTSAEVSDELLRATSRTSDSDLEHRLALLGGVRRGVDEAFGTVTLGVDDVTLTDRDGTVPIRLARPDGVPIVVRVEVSGPAALAWTDGRVREVTLAVGDERALEVPVRSGATGRFPVTVRVTDPTGERVLVSDVIGVRATAVAGPALALIAAIVLVLVIIGTLRQRRRGLALRTVAGPRDEEVHR